MKKIYAVYCRVKLIRQPEWLDSFREKYDENYDFHITLKQMAYIEEGQLLKIQNKLKAVFAELPAEREKIRLSFDKLVLDETKPEGNNGFIYLFSTDKFGRLGELQQIIREELADYSDYCYPESYGYEHDFKPHITIARNLDAMRFKEAKSAVKDDFVCLGEVTDVVLSCVKEVSLAESKNPDNLTIYNL